MPYEKNLSVKHLKVKSSETIPIETLNTTKILYGEDSGKTLVVPALTAPITVTLPSAEVGRVLKIVANPTATADSTIALGQTATFSVKNVGEYIVGCLLTADGTNTAVATSAIPKDGTSSTSVQLTAAALASAEITLVCTSKGLWTVTALAVVPDVSTPAFA